MAEQSIRFGISHGKLRAATWKLWTPRNKSDVYLACRALNGELKASLHESGQWHVAYSQKFFAEKVPATEGIHSKQGRFVQQWSRPAPLVKGITLAYRIMTPHASVTSQISAADSKVSWLPNCPAGKATEVDIFILSSPRVSDWPGKHGMETQLVGSYKLPIGDSVWVVYSVINLPNLSRAMPPGVGRFYKGKTKDDLKSAPLRAIAFADGPDGSKVIYDFAVKNLIQTESV